MQTPPQVTFHQLPSSPALEAHVRDRIDELEKLFDGIVSCRVSIEAPGGHHRHGGLYRVGIEIGVPGDQIVVRHAPAERATHADAYVAVHDAFRAARRQLEDYVRRLHGSVKVHAAPPQGRVVHLEPDFEHGRLLADDGREIYFHRNSVVGGIEHLALGTEVRFHEEAGARGPQASTVQAVGVHGHHTL